MILCCNNSIAGGWGVWLHGDEGYGIQKIGRRSVIAALRKSYHSPALKPILILRFKGDVVRATNAKIAVYSCPFDSMATETKGTVLLKSASELLEFSKGEEDLIEQVSNKRCKNYVIIMSPHDVILLLHRAFIFSK